MVTPIEPKDGNRGMKKPTLPLQYLGNVVEYMTNGVKYTMLWKDALGEEYTSKNTVLHYDMVLVETNDGGNNSEEEPLP